jgi:hypothetical protein
VTLRDRMPEFSTYLSEVLGVRGAAGGKVDAGRHGREADGGEADGAGPDGGGPDGGGPDGGRPTGGGPDGGRPTGGAPDCGTPDADRPPEIGFYDPPGDAQIAPGDLSRALLARIEALSPLDRRLYDMLSRLSPALWS